MHYCLGMFCSVPGNYRLKFEGAEDPCQDGRGCVIDYNAIKFISIARLITRNHVYLETTCQRSSKTARLLLSLIDSNNRNLDRFGTVPNLHLLSKGIGLQLTWFAPEVKCGRRLQPPIQNAQPVGGRDIAPCQLSDN